MEILMRTNSDEDRKILRAELKRLNIKYNEKDEKTLTEYNLSDDLINKLDLSKIYIFKNIIKNNVSYGAKMLVSQNPLIWNR